MKKRDFESVKAEFSELLKKAAKASGTHPHLVEAIDFWDNRPKTSNLSEWEVRKYGGFSRLRELVAPYSPTPADLKKEILSRDSKASKKLAAGALKKDLLLDDIRNFSSEVFSGQVKASPYVPAKPSGIRRILNAVISDVHIGANVSKLETGALDYGILEESRRLAFLAKQIAEYKIEHRDDTELELLLLGDLIQNLLHDPRGGAPRAEQICRAIHLLIQMIAYLSTQFRAIRVRCSSGNHGRNTSRHHDRAVNQKWDSDETILCYSLKAACSALKNVSFDIPLTPYGVYDNFGSKILYTHGDTVLNPGYPGRTINVKKLEEQINRINASLADKDEIKVVVVGHVHVGSFTKLSNGTTLITNGAVIPVDEYAVSIGLLESQAGQYIFESVKGHPVGDIRFVEISSQVDSESSWDKLITPWQGL